MKHLTINFSMALALGFGLILVLLALLSNPGTGLAMVRVANSTLYVAPKGIDSGSDCADTSPCATVQYAVDQADAGAEIRVASGTYTDVYARPRNDFVTTGDVTQVVYISKPVTIRGGYTTTNWTMSYPITQPTTLDAQGQGRVLYITGGISPTFEGLHITGGNATGLGGQKNTDSDSGGGVYIITATVTFNNNWVFSNTAKLGGGLHLSSGSAALSGNSVTSNTATALGGGLHFAFNSAGVLLVTNIISGNKAGSGGGLAFRAGSNVILVNNTIMSNTAGGFGFGTNFGGGLYMSTCDNATLTSNVFRGNHSENAEGTLFFTVCTDIKLNRNIISNNFTGGLFFARSSNVTLTNNIIADNQSTLEGGALRIAGSSLQLLHNTIARNSSGGRSGVYVINTVKLSSTVTLTNTILVSHALGITVTAGNTVTLDTTLWGSGAWANDVDWGGAGTIVTGTVNIFGDPDFVDAAGGDYHIGAGSAAIDRGVNAGVTTDIDGDIRPIGLGFDIGADEARIINMLPLILKNQ